MGRRDSASGAAHSGVVTIPGFGVLDFTKLTSGILSVAAIENLSVGVVEKTLRIRTLWHRLEQQVPSLLPLQTLPGTIQDPSDVHIPAIDELESIEEALSALDATVVDDQALLLIEVRDLVRCLLEHQREVQSSSLIAAEGAPVEGPQPEPDQREPDEPSRVVSLTYAAKHWFRCSPSTLSKDIRRGNWAATRLSRQRFRFDLREVASMSPEAEDDALDGCPDRG